MKLNCCICEKEKSDRIYKKIEGFTLWQCPRCGLVYLKEPPKNNNNFILAASQDLDKDKKQKVVYWSFPNFYEKHEAVFKGYFTERLARIRRFKPDVNSMLDIGCGYGFWLKFCRDEGIDAKGLDLSDEAINYARTSLKLDVEKRTLEDYEFDKKYDTIVMCDLLEHLHEPNEALKKINAGLSKAGLFFIQVPNLLGFKLPPAYTFCLPYHIWQFDVRTLGMLLRKNGFEILDWWTGILGVIGVYESGGPGILDKMTWQVARTLKVGNRLIVAAKKV